MTTSATCRHVMPSGLRCQALAMRGSAFCYHHGRCIPPARKNKPTEHRIEIPAMLDQHGISQALANVLQGLADGRVSPRRASILLWGLRTAAGSPDFPPASAGPSADLISEEIFGLIDESDEESTSLLNALAAKLGLDSHVPLSEGPTPKG